MGHKYLVTNISGAPRFLTERGKLLHHGESCTANRLDATTQDTGWWDVQEGDFDPAAPAAKVAVEKQRYDDDDDDRPVAKKAEPAGPAQLVDVARQSKVVPLVAAGAKGADKAVASTPAAPLKAVEPDTIGDDLDDDDGGSLTEDELDGEVAKAVTPAEAPTKGSGAGFVDRTVGSASSDDPLVGR